jgi:hypothetical protein
MFLEICVLLLDLLYRSSSVKILFCMGDMFLAIDVLMDLSVLLRWRKIEVDLSIMYEFSLFRA